MTDLYLSQEEFQDIFKNHLKIEVYSKPIESLFSVRSRNKIDFSPYYQRNYVWDETKATYFIESIILGTEIPPLIFFNNSDSIEVIDGRQRFETLARFFDGELSLKRKGLGLLKGLDRKSIKTLPDDVLDVFLTSTMRIIEFEIVNEPKLDPLLQDKVKKEIFGRYNSGITPLKKAEVETAAYIDDEITKSFKVEFEKHGELESHVERLFFRATFDEPSRMKLGDALSFVRRMLVQYRVPVTYFAQGKKGEVLKRLYDQFGDSIDDCSILAPAFLAKVEFVAQLTQFLRDSGLPHNRSLNECLLWGLFVVENEGEELPSTPPTEDFLNAAKVFFTDNFAAFDETDRHFYGPVIRRYNSTIDFYEQQCGISLHIYRAATEESKDNMRELMNSGEAGETISEMESLRLNKPDPTRLSIEDIHKLMTRRKFLVRPPYQRQEVINLPKASSIIESILLGIALPVIFVFKRTNGVSEVIDGQQRLLTILGFIQAEYTNELGKSTRSKNHAFKLRSPRILTEFKGAAFHELPADAQDRIMDFQLFVVTIEERLNEAFDPVDLFIRLNDKPYPIKEHSFEMWNSWVDKEIITALRKLCRKNLGWLYVRVPTQRNFRDRMENEEALAIMSYLSAQVSDNTDFFNDLDLYQKDLRLNTRIKGKNNVTNALIRASESEKGKAEFQEGVKATRRNIKKLRLVLLNRNIEDEKELNAYLEARLNELCHPDKSSNVRRAYQDYYVLWMCLDPLSLEITQFNRLEMYDEIRSIFRFFREVPKDTSDGADAFRNVVLAFHQKYKIEPRRLKLSELEKANLIRDQENECSISGAPIFVGDEIHVDHEQPLATGGADDASNMGISHPDANLRKGAKVSDK
ncbi:MAG: DUF262 domain-containing protein [Pirellulaceae bacterium]